MVHFLQFFKEKKNTSLPYFGVAAEGLGANSKMAKELMKLLPYLRSHLGTHCNVSSSHFLLYNMLDFCKCTPRVFVFLFSFFFLVVFINYHFQYQQFGFWRLWIIFPLYKFNFEPNDKWVLFYLFIYFIFLYFRINP